MSGWPWPKPLSKPRPGYGPMPEKYTWRGRTICIVVLATTMVPWLNWKMARRSLPNDPRLFELTGYILRRRGQPEEGSAQFGTRTRA